MIMREILTFRLNRRAAGINPMWPDSAASSLSPITGSDIFSFSNVDGFIPISNHMVYSSSPTLTNISHGLALLILLRFSNSEKKIEMQKKRSKVQRALSVI